MYIDMMRLFSRDLRLYLVATALIGFTWDGMRAVTMNLYLLRLGYGPEFIGLVNGVAALSFAIVCLPAGIMGTRWGNRNALIAGLVLLAIGFGCLPLADFFVGDARAVWLVATSITAHTGLALFMVNGLPFMMAVTGNRERDYAFSVHAASMPLAAFLGSLTAGILPGLLATAFGVTLENAQPYRFSLWLVAVLPALAAVVLLRTRLTSASSEQNIYAQAPADKHSPAPYLLLIAVAAIMAFRFGGWGAMLTFFNVYLDQGLGAPTLLIGVLSGVALLLSVPAALAAPAVIARKGHFLTIFWGTMLMALLALPLALIPVWPAAGIGFLGAYSMFSMTAGPMRVFTQELVVPRWRASMASVYMMGAGLAFSGMSLVGGFAIVAWGYNAFFVGACALVAAGAVTFWSVFRVPRGEQARRIEQPSTD